MNSSTTIKIALLNRLGDEIGEVELENARVPVAGTDTASPDLADQMAQLDRRLYRALAELDLAPVLDPLAVRIAVSRALLQPTPAGVVIALQIMPADGTPQRGEAARVPDPARAGDGWDGMFALSAEEESFSMPVAGPPGGKPDRQAPGGSGGGGLDDLGRANQLDEWEALGQAWEMDGMDDDEEGGWK